MTINGKVYSFYITIIVICVLAMFFFHLNIYAKAVLCTIIVLCLAIMRGVKTALTLPPNIDSDTMEEIKPMEYNETGNIIEPVSETEENEVPKPSTIEPGDNVDTYLKLLFKADKELSNGSSAIQNSPDYNNRLNERISELLKSGYDSEEAEKSDRL